jgi:hypothetical protein
MVSLVRRSSSARGKTVTRTRDELVQIACDESGYEGEKLIGGMTDVFAHASVRLDGVSATRCVQELRSRIRSPATEYKANHLLRDKHPRVQLADILAGAARKIASDQLGDSGDAELTALLLPFVDEYSIWGDGPNSSRLGLRLPTRRAGAFAPKCRPGTTRAGGPQPPERPIVSLGSGGRRYLTAGSVGSAGHSRPGPAPGRPRRHRGVRDR